MLLHDLLGVWRDTLPDPCAGEKPETIPCMVSDLTELLNFVEFCRLDQGERVFLTVRNFCLQRGVSLVEGNTDGSSAERREHRNAQRHDRHANFEVGEILRGRVRMRAAADLPKAIVPSRGERNQTDLLDIASDEIADLAVHRGPHLVV